MAKERPRISAKGVLMSYTTQSDPSGGVWHGYLVEFLGRWVRLRSAVDLGLTVGVEYKWDLEVGIDYVAGGHDLVVISVV